MKPLNRIIFALDLPDLEKAKPYIEILEEKVGMFKVGLELFIKEGRNVIDYINKNTKTPVFLDLKILDIPKTVERSVKSAKDLGIEFFTIHAHDRQTLSAASSAADGKISLLGVTVLTSLNSENLEEQGLKRKYFENPGALVRKRVAFSYECGLKGVVCSPFEASFVKNAADMDFLAVTPGIRLSYNKNEDQKRFTDPYNAIKNGSDYIVVGRPVRDAENPAKEAEKILKEIERAELEKKQ